MFWLTLWIVGKCSIKIFNFRLGSLEARKFLVGTRDFPQHSSCLQPLGSSFKCKLKRPPIEAKLIASSCY